MQLLPILWSSPCHSQLYNSQLPVENVTSTKLLVVTSGHHFHFTSHIDDVLKRSNPVLHALITLKTAGLDKAVSLTLLCSVITSKLTYAALDWFPYISLSDSEILECRKKLCPRIMFPEVEQYIDRLIIGRIDELKLLTFCVYGISIKIWTISNHPLHKFLIDQLHDIRVHPAKLTATTSVLSRPIFLNTYNFINIFSCMVLFVYIAIDQQIKVYQRKQLFSIGNAALRK